MRAAVRAVCHALLDFAIIQIITDLGTKNFAMLRIKEKEFISGF